MKEIRLFWERRNKSREKNMLKIYPTSLNAVGSYIKLVINRQLFYSLKVWKKLLQKHIFYKKDERETNAHFWKTPRCGTDRFPDARITIIVGAGSGSHSTSDLCISGSSLYIIFITLMIPVQFICCHKVADPAWDWPDPVRRKCSPWFFSLTISVDKICFWKSKNRKYFYLV
mgnify:CR=1 FL=1